MRIPYVIDNIQHRLADVLNHLLKELTVQEIDIATAYFSIRGYQQLRHNLPKVRSFRLLLGDEPRMAEDIGLRPDSANFLRNELNAEPLRPETQQLVEEMLRFLHRDNVEVRLYLGHDPAGNGRRHFLHAKCYLLYGDFQGQQLLFDRLNPLVGIVGSSNFTAPGLTTNRELNMVHKTLLSEDEVQDELAHAEVIYHAKNRGSSISTDNRRLIKSEVGARAIIDLTDWYQEQWEQSIEYKQDLIEILDNSKFGMREYTPYEIYMKALFEYFKDDLDTDFDFPATRSAVELTEFQEDAVKKARRILARYDGVIVGDSVGLGKTWIGKKLLEDRAYHMRQKALVICPASIRTMWEAELREAAIAATVLSQEALGQKDFDTRPYHDVDMIVIDEAHNFRNRLSQRYQNLEIVIAANGRRGRDGMRKKVVLLTATPINNNIFDLYNQINLFAGNDRTYFASAGIGDLRNYFLAARRSSVEEGSIKIFNLLEEVVIRRTRHFIRQAYPEATIHGRRITWPQRQLQTVEYDLEATYEGFYRDIVRRIEGLNLAHYNLESYKVSDDELDDFELGRQVALVGIFKSRFLKRLESSIESFRISVRRALEFVKTFEEYVEQGIILDSASFRTAMRLLVDDDQDDDNDAPESRATEIDTNTVAREIIESLPQLDADKYNLKELKDALCEDIDAFQEIWQDIQAISIDEDAKLQRVKSLLLSPQLVGQKVIIFTYYKDTARYIYRALTAPESDTWLSDMGDPHIRRIDSSIASGDRPRIVEAFAPVASGRPELQGTEQEIDILIATDVLSEGHNLQDCGYLINYDLHWNPTRMVQRAGRIDRLGSLFDTLTIFNLFPERELEILLGLVKSLTAKIDTINQTGFLDASVLGEVVTPRDFNTLRRIADEDDSVVEEQESFLELASSEVLLAQLQNALSTEARTWISDLDDGIHSGLQRKFTQGVFFYYIAPHPEGEGVQHFWRYYDLNKREIIDNRYQIMQLIACNPETPRFPPPYENIDIYKLQENIIDSIIADVEIQQSASVTSKPVSTEQATVSEILRGAINQSGLDRNEIKSMRRFLREPLVGMHIRLLRDALKAYEGEGDLAIIVDTVRNIQGQLNFVEEPQHQRKFRTITRDDLRLVCFEYICS